MFMGITDWYKKAKHLFVKEAGIFNAGEGVVDNMPYLYTWFWTAQLGIPRQIDLIELRKYGKSCWIQMVKNAIKKQVMVIPWKIQPRDPDEDPAIYAEQVKQAEQLLLCPNRNNETFWDVWGAFMDDVLDLDAGVIYKARNTQGKLVELYAHDGGRFLIDIEEHGIIRGYVQYSYKFPQGQPKYFRKEDIIYGRVGVNTEYKPYGYSPLQAVQQEVEVMIQSTRFNKDLFGNSAIPDGIITVPMEKDQLTRFQTEWEQKIKGKPHKLIFNNVQGADFKQLKLSQADMEWLDGRKWYFHTVFAVYGVSPAEVGFYDDVNRGAQEGQERTTIRNAIKPYLALIEDKISREILTELFGHDKLVFKFNPQDHQMEMEKHKQTMEKLMQNVYTVNEVRQMEGLEPVAWGYQPFNLLMQQNYISGRQAGEESEEGEEEPGEEGEEEQEGEKPEEGKKPNPFEKPEKEEKALNQREFVESEAKSYADFLEKKFKSWEKKVLSFVETTLTDEVRKEPKPYIEKTFGDFLRRLLNVINVVSFKQGLVASIKATLKDGIGEAEKELNLDIGFTGDLNKTAELMADQQLEGFSMDNGERWAGIKGVSRQLQNDISQIVRDGIANMESIDDIKRNIKDLMIQQRGGKRVTGEVTEGRAMRIARTETNRFLNYGKLQSYKDSGVVKGKRWEAFIDHRTCDVCKRLNKQWVGLFESFKDPLTGKEYTAPPQTHCNCRCTTSAVLK